MKGLFPFPRRGGSPAGQTVTFQDRLRFLRVFDLRKAGKWYDNSDMKSLDPIFKPKSVAVIGATARKGSIGHELIHNIIEFEFNGKLFPVNPRYEFIHSIKAYPSVADIPDEVDLAIIVVPKDKVLGVAEECGRKGVKGLVVISAGFKEVGGEGVKREEALVALARKYGFRIVGPNCMGLINATEKVRLNATFAPLQPESGVLAMMSQSGALGVAILLAVKKLGLGLSYFVSVGNKADISGNSLLEYWESDKHTEVIALYLESFGNPRKFTQISKRITKKKPIVVVKSGTTAAGARAASSHTGALAGLEIAVDALLHQCGVIRTSTIEEMMDLVLGLTKSPLPAGDRIAILTNAGGPGIMAADAVETQGLKVATLSDKTKSGLREILPKESTVTNPVDMLASAGADQYARGAELLLADEGVDMMIVIFVPPIMVEPKEVVRKVSTVVRRFDKAVLSVLMAEERYFEELPREIKDAPPFYAFPETAVRVAAQMHRYRQWQLREEGQKRKFPVRRDRVEELVCSKQRGGGGFLSPGDVFTLLGDYGFPVCRYRMVPVGGEVVSAGEQVGFPLVLKAYGEELIHKSDVGGVVLNIRDTQELLRAVADVEENLRRAGMVDRLEGYFLQEMAGEGKEVILGVSMDPKFGPLVMFGMGGKYVEVMKDIVFRVMPVTDQDAWEMVRSIKGYPLLEGVRGDPRLDVEFLVESILRLAQMVDEIHCLAELDMNPIIVTPRRETCRVVDARVRIGEVELY